MFIIKTLRRQEAPYRYTALQQYHDDFLAIGDKAIVSRHRIIAQLRVNSQLRLIETAYM